MRLLIIPHGPSNLSPGFACMPQKNFSMIACLPLSIFAHIDALK